MALAFTDYGTLYHPWSIRVVKILVIFHVNLNRSRIADTEWFVLLYQRDDLDNGNKQMQCQEYAQRKQEPPPRARLLND